MANEYFQPGSVPAPNAPGSSAVMRQEFASISQGFDKLPILAGHANELVTVNATGTALVTSGAMLGDYVTKDGVFTLTNKTMAWADNIWPGFGTGATKNAGTGAGEVLLLSQSNKLPALDGSLLTGVTTSQISGVTDIAHGGTGATTLGGAQAALGIDLKADANNAVLTGAPTAPTPPTGDNSARVATTYFVTETLANIGSFAPSNAAPLMNGVANAGVGALGSRDDHVHPTDTTRAPVNSPTFTGNPTAPTPAVNDNDTSIATTAFVNAEIDADRPYPNAVPLMDGVAAMGAAANVARQDHVHPTDTTRAPVNSPTFTGDPRAPTPLTSDNDTSIATTAFVQSLIAQQPPGVQVSNSSPLMNGAVAPGTGIEASRYDHVHPSDTSRVAKSGDTMTGPLTLEGNTYSIISMRVSGAAKGYFYADEGGVGILNSLANMVLLNPIGTADLAVAGNLTAANLSGTNTGNQTAAQVPFTPAGNIAATNVQAAVTELDNEKAPKANPVFTGLSVINVADNSDALVVYNTSAIARDLTIATSPYSQVSIIANRGALALSTPAQLVFSAGSGVVSNSNFTLNNVPTIWNSSSGQAWQAAAEIGTGNFVIFGVNNPGSGAYLPGSGGNWVALSDGRYKENLVPIGNALSKVAAINGYIGNFKGQTVRKPFVIAQDVQAVIPEAVDTSREEHLSMDYADLVPLLIEAIKELRNEMDSLRSQLSSSLRPDSGAS
jgi:hypothetical protein